jgi:hypothetical protein
MGERRRTECRLVKCDDAMPLPIMTEVNTVPGSSGDPEPAIIAFPIRKELIRQELPPLARHARQLSRPTDRN